MTQPRQRSWIEVAVRNAGIRKGFRGLSWALSWAIARESVGHDPTAEEVAEWWKQAPRSAYREQAAFRAAFPNLSSPAELFTTADARAKLTQAVSALDKADGRHAPSEQDVLGLAMLPAH